MSVLQLKSDLKTTGMPVTYSHWPEKCAPPLPYICYLINGSEPLFADGGVYYKYDRARVELYTRLRDLAAEEAVEASLSGYHWKKAPAEFISSQGCYLTLYEIEV